MKITTIIAAACIAASSLHAAEYSTLNDAYKAKDWDYVAAQTNQLMLSLMSSYNLLDYRGELANAYSKAGKYFEAAQLYFASSKNDEATAECKKLAADGFITKYGKTIIPINGILYEDTEYFRAAIAKFAELVKNDPATATSLQNFINLANANATWNRRNPQDTIDITLTDDLVLAYSKQHRLLSVIFALADHTQSLHFNDIMFKNCAPTSDKYYYLFAFRLDQYNYRTHTYQEAIFNKIKDCALRTQIALNLNDPDKLLLALADIKQDTFNASSIEAILKMLNGQKSDWRPDEVKKVLMDINSMYTTKLYDDRNTWEPVLSKLRAMIEIR